MQHYLPMVMLLNMIIQAGLLFAAVSTAKNAARLLVKARALGAPAL